MNRKTFLQSSLSLIASSWAIPSISANEENMKAKTLIPKGLKPGDTVAIVSPAGGVLSDSLVKQAAKNVETLGFKAKIGQYVGEKWGYLGGKDTERISDIHAAFSDKKVKAIIALRGGYGCSRLLPMLDMDLIRANPKIFVGYSDNTSILQAIHQKTGLITYYGPNALDEWTDYTLASFKEILTNPAKSIPLHNHPNDRLNRLVGGVAEGALVGGNLSLIIQSMGTPWEIDTTDKILFFEETNESPYRIDRMLTHLWLARKLQKANGFIIGQMTNISGQNEELNLREILKDRLAPLGKACVMNSSFGHVPNKLTLPIGTFVRLDANKMKVDLQGQAVS